MAGRVGIIREGCTAETRRHGEVLVDTIQWTADVRRAFAAGGTAAHISFYFPSVSPCLSGDSTRSRHYKRSTFSRHAPPRHARSQHLIIQHVAANDLAPSLATCFQNLPSLPFPARLRTVSDSLFFVPHFRASSDSSRKTVDPFAAGCQPN